MNNNTYAQMQKTQYSSGTSNHEEHNNNPDYWDVLLSDLKNKDLWEGKKALDFGCGKGRNVINMFNLCSWAGVDGIDISGGNIDYCNKTYIGYSTKWYCNNGTDVSDLKSNEYDFIMSTITLQHIPVYSIRKSLITDLLRTLKSGGLFSFQVPYGEGLKPGKLASINNKISSYYENSYDAVGTNSAHDFRVNNEQDIINDLKEIGFTNVETIIKPSYSDYNHEEWIYVKAYK